MKNGTEGHRGPRSRGMRGGVTESLLAMRDQGILVGQKASRKCTKGRMVSLRCRRAEGKFQRVVQEDLKG
jgi:hypothetical protein